MQIVNVLAVLMVDDFVTAAAWYERLFDRGPDRRPMATCAEWQLGPGGSIQVFQEADQAGGTTVVLGVDDVDAHVTHLTGRGFVLHVFDTPDGQFRRAAIQDPAGNTVMLGQPLLDAAAANTSD
jgi:predicted enzyme related to lactoylglutathione lyase